MTDTGDPHSELFDAAIAALRGIEENEWLGSVVLHFEMTALRLLGHVPSFEQCASCGAAMVAQGEMAFGMLAGGVVCRRCRGGQRQVIRVRGATINALRQVSTDRTGAQLSDSIDRRKQLLDNFVLTDNYFLQFILHHLAMLAEFLQDFTQVSLF